MQSVKCSQWLGSCSIFQTAEIFNAIKTRVYNRKRQKEYDIAFSKELKRKFSRANLTPQKHYLPFLKTRVSGTPAGFNCLLNLVLVAN